MNADEKNKNKIKDKKRLTILIVACLILIILIIITAQAYAKYTAKRQGTIEAQVAEAICSIEVEPSEASIETVNPYCLVTVKNYNDDDEVTQTDIRYKIEVTPKGNFELPQYYWEDENGTIVAQSTDLTGTIPLENEFGIAQKQEHEYKIVFINPGDRNIVYEVEFNLTATQK